jgi:DNA-binding NtrC family response regulator
MKPMGKKILVVDDNPVVTEALEDILKRKGYEEVTAVNSGQEALQLLKKEKPGLILLDIMMPRMNGVETLQEIRKIAPDLGLIMMTGLGSTELEYEARKIGVTDFLHKELGLEIFLKTVGKVLGEKEKKPEKKKELRILVVDDDPSVRDLLDDFLTKKGYKISLASNGEEGLSKTKSEKPHLVLVDINMPGMDGLEVLKKIKEDDPSITVIMITGTQEMETARKCLEMGAYDYITKPFNLEYLETSVFSKLALVALDEPS